MDNKIFSYYKNRNILLADYKAIYFFIPKVACTSLKTVCANLLCLPITGSVHFSVDFPSAQDSNSSQYKEFFKFAFVRNPWDRLVSCYKSKIRQKDLNSEYFENGVEFNLAKYGSLFKGEMSFKDFALAIGKIDDEDADDHFKSQYKFIFTDKDDKKVDFTGKFESLQKNFDFVCKKLGIERVELPHLQKTDHLPYQSYYDNETISLVGIRYKKDIEFFSYKY